MPVYCCPRCRITLTFQRKHKNVEFQDGHWYGCSHCGQNLCTRCGIELGRRCDRCGGVLEKDRGFPKRVIADGDWRSFVPKFDDDRWWMNNLELIAYATPERVTAILDAIPEAAADEFWDQMLDWEISRRLGALDRMWSFPSGEYLLDDPWRANLARVAAAGLQSRSALDEGAVSLGLRLAGWKTFADLARHVPDVVVEALEDRRRWLVEQALGCLATLTLSKAELLARFGDWLGADDPELRLLGIRAVVAGWGDSWGPGDEYEAEAYALIVDQLPRYTPAAIVDALADDRRGWLNSPIVRLCRELGLGDALLERFSSYLVRTHPRFCVAVSKLAEALQPGHPLLDEIVQKLVETGTSRSKRARLLGALAVAGDPRHAALEQSPRESVEDPAQLEDRLAKALTIEGLAYRHDPRLAESPRYQAELAARRPRLILEAQRELAQGRERALTALGRLRTEPGDGPETLLVDAFVDTSASVHPRLLSAQALSQAPLAPASRQRIVAVTTDPRVLVRAWAYVLVDEPQQWALAERDASEVVRDLAQHRARS